MISVFLSQRGDIAFTKTPHLPRWRGLLFSHGGREVVCRRQEGAQGSDEIQLCLADAWLPPGQSREIYLVESPKMERFIK